jgi:hypothetical protein
LPEIAFPRPMTKLARLRSLPPRDFAILVQMVAFCCIIASLLRISGWQRVSRLIDSSSRSSWLRQFPLFHLHHSIEHLSRLADMASSVCPRNRCLVRSMVLLWLLRTRGESAEVVLGVRKRAGVFEAHAWTVTERGPAGDQPEAIADFETLITSGRPQP